MTFLTVLITSSIINFQQPVQPLQGEQIIDTKTIDQIATDYLKIRISDADFIQPAGIKKTSNHDYHVFLVFSADSTPVNTCVIHIHQTEQSIHTVERITCLNYEKKIGFQENVYSTVYD